MKLKKIDPILIGTIIFQLIFLIVIISNLLYPKVLQVRLLRQFVAFLYLTFIPGILILRLLLGNNINKLRLGEFLIYMVGLSFSFLMFLGFMINTLLFIISKFTNTNILLKPFSILVLGIAIQVFVTVLWILNYIKYKYICYDHLFKQLHLHFKSIIIFLYLPILSIISVYLIDYDNENILALFLIILILVILIGVAFNKLHNRNYPTAIWAISLSLLFLNSLIGKYPKATDNIVEISLSNLVITRGFWDNTIPINVNSMLGVVMIIPIYSIVCSMDLICIYKLILPIFSSIIPIGLYEAFRKITDDKISFFSCFFFISMYEYYTWFGLTMKMITAGLFLTLLMLIITDKELNVFSKSILLIIFAYSLSVSHYGTSYIFMFCLVSAFILNIIINKIKNIKNPNTTLLFNLTFIASYIVFTISWYIYNSLSYPYKDLINIGNQIIKSLKNRYIMPNYSYSYQVIKGRLPLYLQILKILYIISLIFIIIGLINVILKHKFKFNNEYLIISILFFISGGSIFLGGLSGIATPDRIYQIICFFLAPFCVIGGIKFVDYVRIFLRIKNNKFDSLKTLLIFFIIFLLFNTCFITEVVWKYNIGPVISISKPRIFHDGTIEEKEYFNRVYMLPVDVKGAEWLWQHIGCYHLYCDKNSRKIFVIAKIISKNKNNKLYIHMLINNIICKNSYIYLSSFNTKTNKIKIGGSVIPKFINLTQVPKINSSIKIYTNGNCEIYYYI